LKSFLMLAAGSTAVPSIITEKRNSRQVLMTHVSLNCVAATRVL